MGEPHHALSLERYVPEVRHGAIAVTTCLGTPRQCARTG